MQRLRCAPESFRDAECPRNNIMEGREVSQKGQKSPQGAAEEAQRGYGNKVRHIYAGGVLQRQPGKRDFGVRILGLLHILVNIAGNVLDAFLLFCLTALLGFDARCPVASRWWLCGTVSM